MSSRPVGPAFLLAQIGAHAARLFAERLAPLGLTPAHAGILWNLSHEPGLTQRELAERLDAFPSRLVLLLDELEKLGFIERQNDPHDRRIRTLCLTAAGKRQLERIGEVAREHQADLCQALDSDERNTLRELLQKVASQQGLRARVHPGFR